MNQILISDQHLKALQSEAARREGPSLKAETILSEWLDEIIGGFRPLLASAASGS